MNKTRFYEITQAAAKGEDLSQFVPTNAAEAALIADLNGGGGSAEVSVGKTGTKLSADQFPITKLYFDTSLTDEELVELLDSYRSSDSTNIHEDLGGMPIILHKDGCYFASTVVYTGDGGCSIMLVDMTAQQYKIIYNSSPMTDNSFVDGWNPEYFANKNYVTMQELFGVDEITSFDSMETGEAALEIISKFMSVNNDFKNIVEPLQGTYDGTPIVITAQSSVPAEIDVVALLKENKLPKVIYINPS